MAFEKENGHHDLMDRMQELGAESQREADFLSEVSDFAGAGDEDAPEVSLGARMKDMRARKGLTLTDLAQRSGLSLDLLQQVEETGVSPSLGDLIKIGKALDMKMGTMIAGGKEVPYTVVRVNEREKMSRFGSERVAKYGYSYRALAPQMKNRAMEPFLVTLRKTDDEPELSSHDGDEFIMVLEGVMEAVMGDTVERLEPGDSIYYKSLNPHLVRPAGADPVTIVAVIFAGR